MNEEDDHMSVILDKESNELSIMANIRKIAQETMKEKGLTFNDVLKSLGIKRYDK